MSKKPNYFSFLTESLESTDCPAEVECLNGTKYCWMYEIIDEVYEKVEALKRGGCTPADLVKNQVVMYEIILVIICIIDNCCDPPPPPPPSESEPSVSDEIGWNCVEASNGLIHCEEVIGGTYPTPEACEQAIEDGECFDDQVFWTCPEGGDECIQTTDPSGFSSKEECEKYCGRYDCNPETFECEKAADGYYDNWYDCETAKSEERSTGEDKADCIKWDCEKEYDDNGNIINRTCVETPGGPFDSKNECIDELAVGYCNDDDDPPPPDKLYDCVGKTLPSEGKADPIHCIEVEGGRYTSMFDCESDMLAIRPVGCWIPDEYYSDCCDLPLPKVLEVEILYADSDPVKHKIEYNELTGSWEFDFEKHWKDMMVSPWPQPDACCFVAHDQYGRGTKWDDQWNPNEPGTPNPPIDGARGCEYDYGHCTFLHASLRCSVDSVGNPQFFANVGMSQSRRFWDPDSGEWFIMSCRNFDPNHELVQNDPMGSRLPIGEGGYYSGLNDDGTCTGEDADCVFHGTFPMVGVCAPCDDMLLVPQVPPELFREEFEPNEGFWIRHVPSMGDIKGAGSEKPWPQPHGPEYDEWCCPVQIKIKCPGASFGMMLDQGGQKLVDLTGLDIDEKPGMSDITEDNDTALLLDSDKAPLIEPSGPVGLEDSDGKHLFDSGLPTQFPLLEG